VCPLLLVGERVSRSRSRPRHLQTVSTHSVAEGVRVGVDERMVSLLVSEFVVGECFSGSVDY
jgi:hypothetical protein